MEKNSSKPNTEAIAKLAQAAATLAEDKELRELLKERNVRLSAVLDEIRDTAKSLGCGQTRDMMPECPTIQPGHG